MDTILTADQAKSIQENFIVQTRGIVAIEKLIKERAAQGHKNVILDKFEYLFYYYGRNRMNSVFDTKCVRYWKRDPFYTDNDIEVLRNRGFKITSTPAFEPNDVKTIEEFIKKRKWFNKEIKNRDAKEALDILKSMPDTHSVSWD